jgi:hypothetical protein
VPKTTPAPDAPLRFLSPNADKPEPKIFATKAQRHKDTKDFILLFFLGNLVPWWREEKRRQT